MISTSTRLAKTILSAAIAGSMMTAAPALAREQRDKREYSHKYEQRQTRDHRRDHRRDKRNKHGIGVGEVIVGAAILGGLVALLSDNDGDKRHRERYRRTHSRPHRDYKSPASRLQSPRPPASGLRSPASSPRPPASPLTPGA